MRFTAQLQSAGRGGRAVVVPAEVTAALSSRKVAVRVLVNGVEHHSRLGVHAGRTYLGLPAALVRRLGVADGDTLEIDLKEQPEPSPTVEPQAAEPAELTALLTADAGARTAWSALSPASERSTTAGWPALRSPPSAPPASRGSGTGCSGNTERLRQDGSLSSAFSTTSAIAG